jgi:hypothetical protein
MAGPCAEKCQLAEDAAEIKEKQQATHDSTLRMEVKQDAFLETFEEYMATNDSQHQTFFDRTRYAVTWKALGLTTAGILSAIVSIIVIIKFVVPLAIGG